MCVVMNKVLGFFGVFFFYRKKLLINCIIVYIVKDFCIIEIIYIL